MEAIPRATPRARTNREHPVVTRHGLRSLHAATSPFRPTPPRTPFAKITTNVPDVSRSQLSILDAPGEKSHSPRAHRPKRRAGFATITAEKNPKSP